MVDVVIQSNLDLFRHSGVGVVGPTSTTYAWPGIAATASTLLFHVPPGMKLKSARWIVAWNPGTTGTPTKIRLVHFDAGQSPVEMVELIQAVATPVSNGGDITLALQGLIEGGVNKHIGYQLAGNGVQAPTVYLSTIECVWGEGPNYLIPKMTGPTNSAGYTASASSEYYAESPAWKAFDKSQSNAVGTWTSAIGGIPAWLRIDAPSEITPTSYKIWPSLSLAQAPKTWTLEGSNDGSSWTVVDTQASVTGWAVYANSGANFVIPAPQAFSKWRLNITAVDGASVCAVTEFQLIG